jgi:hypothetical protein
MNFVLVVCFSYRIKKTEKMGGLSCGMTCMKYLLLAFNLVFWVSYINFVTQLRAYMILQCQYISLVKNTAVPLVHLAYQYSRHAPKSVEYADVFKFRATKAFPAAPDSNVSIMK